MARTWLITGRGIARKVKNTSHFSNYQIKDLGVEAKRECPNCKHLIDNGDVTKDWPGLPAGVKFDPSDAEILEHLAGKVGLENSKPHMFIDEFIPTLEENEGICYTHPENLPGAKKDGNSIHFFHRTSNAYGTGHRKRRKIHQCGMSEERVRWHKTGKTKPVLENGVHKGWKKIMVLYISSKRGCKPDKANWVIHQYHLGPHEEEKDGELVVSKIFYQHQMHQIDKNGMGPVNDEFDSFTVRVGPRTPKTNTPQPPRAKQNSLYEINEHILPMLLGQEEQRPLYEAPQSPVIRLNDTSDNPAWWSGESQSVEEPDLTKLHESLLCHEVLDSFPPFEAPLPSSYPDQEHSRNDTLLVTNNTGCGYADLDNIFMDTPPDFQLSDLQFGSQESIMSWLDRF